MPLARTMWVHLPLLAMLDMKETGLIATVNYYSYLLTESGVCIGIIKLFPSVLLTER